MIDLTDAQIARMFALAEEISAVKREIPVPPKTYTYRQQVAEEVARATRESLENHREAIRELAALLAHAADNYQS